MAVFACIALLPLAAFAAEEPEIQIQTEGDAANVILTFPDAVRKNIYSLEMVLKVESNAPERTDVEFLFAEGIAKIAESRYHGEDGTLHLYLSGNEALFKEESLNLGKAAFSAEDKEGIIVTVSVDSLKVVNGTKAEDFQKVSYPETKTIELGKGGSSGNEPGGGSGDNGEPDSNGGESTDPIQALREELKKTIELAKTYKEADYSPDSFANLKKAIQAAEEMLNKQDATKEELEAALKDLENAIGAMEKRATGTDQRAAASVSSGDNTAVLPWVTVLAVSMGVMGFGLYRRKCYNR